MTVSMDAPAATVERDGRTYYFCSRHCAHTFENATGGSLKAKKMAELLLAALHRRTFRRLNRCRPQFPNNRSSPPRRLVPQTNP